MPASSAMAGPGHEDLAQHLAPWVDGFPGLALAVDERLQVRYASAPLGPAATAALVGKGLVALVPPEHRAVVEAAVKDALSPGLAHTLEFPLAPAPAPSVADAQAAGAGPITWWLASFSRMQVPGHPRLVLVLAHETTARHREEERLRQAESLMVDTQGITHLGTWYWDISQPHSQWSDELYRIYGLDPRHHVPTYQDYLGRIHPDDVERVKAATDAVFHHFQPYSHDERIRHTDGTWRHLHTWARPIRDRDGKLVALAGVCQDITDRVRAEAAHVAAETRFRALFERSEAGLAILDQQGIVLEANPALLAMAGALAPKPGGAPVAVAGRPLEGLALPEHRVALARAIARAAAGQPARCELHLERAGAHVRARIDLAQVAPSPGAGASPPFILAVLADLAGASPDDGQLAMARLKEIRDLEEKGVRRTQLLRVASHELKNPLTPVVFQLHMLQTRMLGPLNDRQGHAVEVATRQVARISGLLRDVLDVARIEEGYLAVRSVPVEVGELARRVVDAYAQPAAQWRVRLEAHPPDGASAPPECWVDADPERLEQALTNLVSNALKFTPRGGTVEVGWDEAGGTVRVWVRDSGPGFTEAQAARLFEAFSQVHAPGQAREEGTGLGLYITRNLVERMGGLVHAQASPGQGATFTVSLPARKDGVAPPHGPPPLPTR